jgi:hypothetical protein
MGVVFPRPEMYMVEIYGNQFRIKEKGGKKKVKTCVKEVIADDG